jgi:hypothetical protein
MQMNRALRRLDLSDNLLGFLGATAIGDMLKVLLRWCVNWRV